MAPNVCRKTHEDFFLEVTPKKVFVMFVGENFEGRSHTKTVWASLGIFGQKCFTSQKICPLLHLSCKDVSYIFVDHGLPLHSEGLLVLHICVGLAWFWERKLQTTRWWSIDSSALFLTRTSTLHGTSPLKLCRKQWVAVDPTNLFTKCTCANPSCWMKVCMMHIALLQHSRSKGLPLWPTSASPCWPTTPFYVPASFPTCVLKSRKRIVHSLDLALRRVSLISSRNSGYNTLEFGACTCIRHREWFNNFSLNMLKMFITKVHNLCDFCRNRLNTKCLPHFFTNGLDTQCPLGTDLT